MTKNVVPFPDQGTMEEEAAHWIILLDRGEPSMTELEALRRWLDACPAHAPCLRRMAALWGRMDCLETLARVIPQEFRPSKGQGWRWLPAAVTALLLVAVLAVIPQTHRQDFLAAETDSNGVEPDELIYRTEKGQQSRIELKDNSWLILNTDSEVRVRFSSSNREVHLVRGEAHFDVFRDSDRPFIVYAGTGWVRAVGTAFSIRVNDDEVEVLVSEGVVEVVPNHAAENASAGRVGSAQKQTLQAGRSARFTNRVITESAQLPMADVERRLAWRQGKWMFEGETLAEVMTEVERYSSYKVVFKDPFLSNVRVGGYFDIGDVDHLMAALQQGFGIRVVQEGNTYYLYPAEG